MSGAAIHRPRHTQPAKSENLVSPVHRNPQGKVAAVHNPAPARARAKVSAAAADRGYDLTTASGAARRSSAKERQVPSGTINDEVRQSLARNLDLEDTRLDY